MNPIVRRVITALSTAAAVVLAIVYAPEEVITVALGLLLGCVLLEYLLLLGKKMPIASGRATAWFLGGVPVLALPFVSLAYACHFHGNLMMLYLIAIVKVGDMGGFALGVSTAKLMRGGNHKLCPTISPNKSWEGLFGSVLAACILSCAFLPITHFAWYKALAFGVAAALVGTFGDLVESKFKRWVGVKDSATFMPAGLGGFLDMFDSLLFAPAVLLPFI